jgi:hypothetical protein
MIEQIALAKEELEEGETSISKQITENAHLEDVLEKRIKHSEALREEKGDLAQQYMKAKEEPSKIKNNINKNEKAV